MFHMFDVEVAKEVGIIAAVLFQNIAFWCQHSYANGTNYYDGIFWTYNSVKAMKAMFPYLSASQIDTGIRKLLDADLVIKGNYNKSAYDRTTWYAITKKGKSIFEKSKMDIQEIENGFPKNREPIPDINTNQETNNINTDKRGRTIPPTKDDVEAFINENGYKINADRFMAYYESNGWKVGRNPMKDWKAAVRTWVSRDNEPRQIAPKDNPAQNYEQREYKDEDYGDDFFIDLDKYGEV